VYGEGPDVEFEKDSTGEWVKYQDVAEDLALLNALRACNVESWEGYWKVLDRLRQS
jgi:hypothetical protein